jgi:hypothetical protein
MLRCVVAAELSLKSWSLPALIQLIIRYHAKPIKLADMLTIPNCRELYLYFDLLISMACFCARSCRIPER